mmetsp:Transcript_73338/g.184860  ORF Transcript_73338/g.184860 Transcript_73338/m.184860 type:complete len:208 (-) Transcript_73338:1623-2246(-)
MGKSSNWASLLNWPLTIGITNTLISTSKAKPKGEKRANQKSAKPRWGNPRAEANNNTETELTYPRIAEWSVGWSPDLRKSAHKETPEDTPRRSSSKESAGNAPETPRRAKRSNCQSYQVRKSLWRTTAHSQTVPARALMSKPQSPTTRSASPPQITRLRDAPGGGAFAQRYHSNATLAVGAATAVAPKRSCAAGTEKVHIQLSNIPT